MDTSKFNPELTLKEGSFVYVEKNVEIKDPKIEEKNGIQTVRVLSYGAVETSSHLAPEFGGVAVVHKNPDFIIAMKYIPWNAKKREEEFEKIRKKIREKSMSNKEIADFLVLEGFVIPALIKDVEKKYQEKKNSKSTKASNDEKKAESIKYYKGEEIIPLD